jgi:hypothetical protein
MPPSPKKTAARKVVAAKTTARKAPVRKTATKKVATTKAAAPQKAIRKAAVKKAAPRRVPTAEAAPAAELSPRDRIRAAAAAMSGESPGGPPRATTSSYRRAAPPPPQPSAPPAQPSARPAPPAYQPPPSAAPPPPPPAPPGWTSAPTAAPPYAPAPAEKRFPKGALIAVLAAVAVVAVVLILVLVVDVFGGDSRPHVNDGVRELVLEESQVPEGYELQDTAFEGCRGPTPPGMTDCHSAEFLNEHPGDLDEILGSAAASFRDPEAASRYLQALRQESRDSAYCEEDGEPVPESEITFTDLPSVGLGDESIGFLLECESYGFMVSFVAWRVENVVQLVGGPGTQAEIKELAEKIEARK